MPVLTDLMIELWWKTFKQKYRVFQHMDYVTLIQ